MKTWAVLGPSLINQVFKYVDLICCVRNGKVGLADEFEPGQFDWLDVGLPNP